MVWGERGDKVELNDSVGRGVGDEGDGDDGREEDDGEERFIAPSLMKVHANLLRQLFLFLTSIAVILAVNDLCSFITAAMDAAVTPPLRIQPIRSKVISSHAACTRLDAFLSEFQQRSTPLSGGDATVPAQLTKLRDSLKEERAKKDN
ncbi:hypothetical protein BXZ70DRAFT_1005674 [Cristinia sonorae]|uniref:Uncharacterized protein n=1 Tax=Cristinia sonorae TaxID=1940300 RepID=A0A8K0UV11_9AGAR|nr:hypothetical protein BXZ70DRAFT_1005674 [Cristinia sonorae]